MQAKRRVRMLTPKADISVEQQATLGGKQKANTKRLTFCIYYSTERSEIKCRNRRQKLAETDTLKPE